MRQDREQPGGLDLRQAARGQCRERERHQQHDHDVGDARHLGPEQVEAQHGEQRGDRRRPRGDRGHEHVQRGAERRGVGGQRHVGAERHPEAEEARARVDEVRGPAVERTRDGTRGTQHGVGEAHQQHHRAGQPVGDRGAGTGEPDRGAGQHDHAAADHLLQRHRKGGRQPDGAWKLGRLRHASRHGRRRMSPTANRASVLSTEKAAPNRSTAEDPATRAAGPASAKPSGESAIVPSQL